MSQMYYTVLVDVETDQCFSFEIHNLRKEETYAFDSPEVYYESLSTFLNTTNSGNYLYRDIPYKKYLEYKKIIKKSVSSDKNFKNFKYTTFRTLIKNDFPELLI